jgi:hypothetical protein
MSKANHKKARGLEALEQRFDTMRVEYLNPRRRSVVGKSNPSGPHP